MCAHMPRAAAWADLGGGPPAAPQRLRQPVRAVPPLPGDVRAVAPQDAPGGGPPAGRGGAADGLL